MRRGAVPYLLMAVGSLACLLSHGLRYLSHPGRYEWSGVRFRLAALEAVLFVVSLGALFAAIRKGRGGSPLDP